jgi:S1-C subfamily serine protease
MHSQGSIRYIIYDDRWHFEVHLAMRSCRWNFAPCVLVLGALFALSQAVAEGHAAERATMAAARESITAADVKRHVDVLADDSFEGREAGSRGGRAASAYLVREFARHKLKPAGDDGTYLQSFFGNCRNVLGVLPGGESALAGEYVIVCAHYDHVGYGSRRNSNGPIGFIHNGADDNASGAAAMLETIEALASLAEPPKRSVLFALWDSEENGLNGSRHWISNPTIPLRGTTAAINLDMVGRLRNDRLTVYGTRTSAGLRRLMCEANRGCELWLDFNWEMKDDSDHHSFFAAGIPVMMFHTGLHDDYHRPSDDAVKINAGGIERVGRLLFNATVALAGEPVKRSFRGQSRGEFPSTQQSQEQAWAPAPSRLGVRWTTEDDGGGPGLRVESVASGSAAQRAGLRPGDRILRFAGEEVDRQRFAALVLAAANPAEAIFRRGGAAEPASVKLQLVGQPMRLGINWRVDDGEPNLVQIVRVVPGSPAANAGIRVLERVCEVNGRGFSSSNEFARLVADDGPLRLLVESQGRMRTVEVTPLKKLSASKDAGP